MVFHGWTLTSKLSFKEILVDAIKPYAFHSSPYPLILSIENHCGVKQQNKMADYLRDILGASLYTEPIHAEWNSLPSPEYLRGKILVKFKKISDDLEDGHEDKEDLSEDSDSDEDHHRPQHHHHHGSNELLDQLGNRLTKRERKKIEQISGQLSDLVNLVQAVKFTSFHDSQIKGRFYHMSSFSETKAGEILDDAKTARKMVEYNRAQLSRIYPSGKRQDSSNLSAIKYWNAGCQIGNIILRRSDVRHFETTADDKHS